MLQRLRRRLEPTSVIAENCSADRSQDDLASERDRKRGQDRVRTFLKALIEFNNGAAKIDCTVKNISPSGARINMSASVSLPKEFDLNIPHRGEVYRSEIVWRERDAIGVRFVGHAVTAGAAPPTAERALSNIEAENIRLRRRVKELSKRLADLGQDPNVDEMP